MKDKMNDLDSCCQTCGNYTKFPVILCKKCFIEKSSKTSNTKIIPILKVLIGIPGSGKSHWVKNQSNALIVCPDNIRKEFFDNISDQTNNTEVFQIAKGMIIAALKLKYNVIFDATNVNTSLRNSFLQNLPTCEMHAILFDVNPSTACSRIKKDIKNGKNRSNVPEHVVYRMYGEYLHTKKVIHSENFKKVTSYKDIK